MPVCRSCGDSFPNRMVIYGKQRILSSRKFCVNCSPFKRHNTKSDINSLSEGHESICKICERVYVYKRGSGHRKIICNSCLQMIRRDRVKDKLVKLLGGICMICGYGKCIAALVFHHKEDDKEFQISGNSYNRSFKIVLKEAKKCDLLCSNCHREKHYMKVEKERREKVKKIFSQSSTVR